MQNPTRLAAAVMMAAMFTLVGLAGAALADKDDPDPKVHKEAIKHQYVNLGLIGDIGIFCGILPTSTGDIVIPDGTRDGSTLVLPDTPIVIPGIRQENFCLGGAIGEYDAADGVSSWDVWIHDYVWNGCDTYTIPAQDGLCPVQPEMGLGVEGIAEVALEAATSQAWTVELKSAGLARTQTTYDRPAATKAPGSDQPFNPLDPLATNRCQGLLNGTFNSGPRVCLQTLGPQSAIRNTNTFGFCGQGSIDMVDPFDTSGGPDGGSATNVEVTKQVFTDSVLFYLLDCPLLDPITTTLKPFYDQVATIINSVTCPDPVLGINIVCVFPLPAAGSSCYSQKVQGNVPNNNQVNIGVVALIGEIGWTHEPTNTCKDTPVHDPWIANDAGLQIVFKGIEPTACVAAKFQAAGFGLVAVSCQPDVANCAIGPFGALQTVSCTVEDGCDAKSVQTTAALLIHVGGDTAAADVLCDGTSVFGGGNAAVLSTAPYPGPSPFNHVPAWAQSAKVLKPWAEDYECKMTFGMMAGTVVPYLGVAACHDP